MDGGRRDEKGQLQGGRGGLASLLRDDGEAEVHGLEVRVQSQRRGVSTRSAQLARPRRLLVAQRQLLLPLTYLFIRLGQLGHAQQRHGLALESLCGEQLLEFLDDCFSADGSCDGAVMVIACALS